MTYYCTHPSFLQKPRKIIKAKHRSSFNIANVVDGKVGSKVFFWRFQDKMSEAQRINAFYDDTRRLTHHLTLLLKLLLMLMLLEQMLM